MYIYFRPAFVRNFDRVDFIKIAIHRSTSIGLISNEQAKTVTRGYSNNTAVTECQLREMIRESAVGQIKFIC